MDEDTPRQIPRREFVLINESVSKQPTVLDRVEQIAKILSIVAIPIVLGVGSWFIQQSVSQQSINKDYVQLAVSILTKSDTEVEPSLRSWAVALLNDKSAVKFSAAVAKELSTGQVKLPLPIFARGGVPFESHFIEGLFSEWNKSTKLSPEFKAILVELADDLLKKKWQKVATFFEPAYYNVQLKALASARPDREGILIVMRQFIHEPMGLGFTGRSGDYVVDLDRISKSRYLDIVKSPSGEQYAIIKFRLIQDDGKEQTTGYEFKRSTYYLVGAYG